MIESESKDLILKISSSNIELEKIEELKNIHKILEHDPKFKEEFEKIICNIIITGDVLLKEGCYYSMMGGFYAFKERELNPFQKGHISIFQNIVDDIQFVYSQINDKIFENDLWFYECFEYGIKKVYYLDWKLYLSKIPY